MSSSDDYGMSEVAIRDLIERELTRTAATTSFYWELDELDEMLDLLTEVFATVIATNNRALTRAINGRGLRNMRLPPGS